MEAANPLSEDGMKEYIQVQLPQGMAAGMELNVRIPDGEVVTIVVPPGAEPGAYIRTPLGYATPAMPSSSGLDESLAMDANASEDVSWVDASLQAEASLRWATWRIKAGVLVGMLATFVGLGAQSTFVAWGEVPLSVNCAAGEGGGDPSVAWMGRPQSTPVNLAMFLSSEEEANILQCTCGSVALENCEDRDTIGQYDGSSVGPRVGTARASSTVVLPAVYTGGFSNPVVILGLPPRHEGYSRGGNEPRAHISKIEPQSGRFFFALRPRCGDAIGNSADGSGTVQISWMVVEAGEWEDIAAGTATSACSGGDLCNTATGCSPSSCADPQHESGLGPVQISFRTERSSPLVLTQLQSHAHGSRWASSTVEDVSKSGFSSRVIPEPGEHAELQQEHPTEIIGWVAFRPTGNGVMGSLNFEALAVPLDNEIPFSFRPAPIASEAARVAIFGDLQDESWSSALTEAVVLEHDHLQYSYAADGRVSVNIERSGCSGASASQQDIVSTVALMSIQEGLAGQSRNEQVETFPCRIVHPCHFTEDGICDEPQGTGLCSPRTDEADCGPSTTSDCRPPLLEVGAATPIRWGKALRQPRAAGDEDGYALDSHECCAFAFSKQHGWNASWYLETTRQLPLDVCCTAEKGRGYIELTVAILMIPVALFALDWGAVDCFLACGCNRNFEFSQTYVRPVHFRLLDHATWIGWLCWVLILSPEVAFWRYLTTFNVALNFCWVLAAAHQKYHDANDQYFDALDAIHAPNQPGYASGPSCADAPSVLRCGECGVVFGIPAGTTAEQAVRCPHCSAVNRQPPTFSTKFAQFQGRMAEQRRQLQRQRKSRNSASLEVVVSRDAVLQSSMSALAEISGHIIRTRPLVIQFLGEDGLDQGGVTREWVDLLFSDHGLLDENWGMFRKADTNDYTYIINPSSASNSDYQKIFAFVGKILAKCLCDGVTIPAHFTPDVYCHLIGVPMAMKDLQLIDTEVFTSISWMLENDVDELGFTFEAETEGKYGSGIAVKELKPNGSNIAVTNANKNEFVKLKARFIMCEQREQQLNALRGGFETVLPLEEIASFDVSELELLLCGVPSLDIEDWKANTVYRSGYNAEHETIQNFWTIIAAWNNDYRAKLLRFVTGTAAIPPGGFVNLQGAEGVAKFSIMKVIWDDPDRLPQASTCFNQLLLPAYSDVGMMRDKLELVINETEGFGLKCYG